MKPKFQRRHYKAVAEVLCRNFDAICPEVIEDFVTIFHADNPHFQPDRFRDACDPPRWETTAAGKEALLKRRAS